MTVQLQAPVTDIDATNDYQSLRKAALDHLTALADSDTASDTHVVHVKLSAYTATLHVVYTYRPDDGMFDLKLFKEIPWCTADFQRRRVVPTRDTHHLGFLVDAIEGARRDVTATVQTITPSELNDPELNDLDDNYYDAPGPSVQ